MNFTGQNDINSTIIEIAHIGVLIFQNTNFSIFDTVLNLMQLILRIVVFVSGNSQNFKLTFFKTTNTVETIL